MIFNWLNRDAMMENSESHWDDEIELAEFIPPEVTLDGHGLTQLERFYHILDHPRFRAMAPGKQLLYLQLLRWSHGCHKEAIEASRVQMSEWSGLAWDTVKKYVPELIKEKVLKIVRPATSVHPTMYEIYWLPPPTPHPQLNSQESVKAITFYVDRLEKEDRAEFLRLSRLLTSDERKEIQSAISWGLQDLGIPWNYELIKKLVTWQYLIRSPYRRVLQAKHPDWFVYPDP